MKTSFKSAAVCCAVGLTLAAASAQAAQHDHSAAAPPPQQPAGSPAQTSPAERMPGMETMMADPEMRRRMIADMGRCRDMMTMMMEHMQHHGQMGKPMPAPPKP